MFPENFDLSAKEQLKEWKTKAKKASWPIVTDGAFEQEPTEGLVQQWIETRAAGDRLQVAGGGSFTDSVRAADFLNADGSPLMQTLTQAEYDGLTPNANTVYFII